MTGRERSFRSAPRGKLRALRDWLIGADAVASGPSAQPGGTAGPEIPRRIGRYPILRKLGQGGMGVVYEAHDDRLGRTLAVKTLRGLSDESARKRFWREARAAASVNHPNVCTLYEVGEEDGIPFIAMELLEGEALSERLARGPMPVAEAADVCLSVLAALAVLHEGGVVHRDLKPSNVFLTTHGVKLLDFGLARPVVRLSDSLDSLPSESDITQTGAIVGTPHYMAPEQVLGETIEPRTDLFATGAILFEMLAGRRAFAGRTAIEVLHATLYEEPPALSGSGAVAALDRVVRRALAKAPKQRYPTAQSMAGEVRAALELGGSEVTAVARTLIRLVVLPFRSLRPDPDTEFLAFSLPDAISTSLSGLGSLVVRSSAAAARFGGESPDLQVIAAEADVDHVVTGMLLRAGDQLRVTTQLVEAPSGTLVASHTAQSALGDLFALQDDLARRLTEALTLPFGGRNVPGDVPGSALAYEFYLRGKEVSRRYDQFPVARDLYLRCLELDPRFAPAWAQLGRCYRLIGKYQFAETRPNYLRAEQAFQRALGLNPELSVAHKFYAHLEAELGRAPQAMARLLGRAQAQRNDAEIFAGLVYTCRYSGLFDASVAAHREARRLDPHIPTSLPFTLLWMGDHDRLAEEGGKARELEPRLLSLAWRGRRSEARAVLDCFEGSLGPELNGMLSSLRAYVEGRVSASSRSSRARDEAVQGLATTLGQADDPEALFTFGCWMAHLGEREQAMDALSRSVHGGFYAATTLAEEPAFDAFRSDPRFLELQRHAEDGRAAALSVFRDAGGERLLGLEAQRRTS
jgi:serine/threonine protein kinase/tetratricopeptide (TPR) repeat protein